MDDALLDEQVAVLALMNAYVSMYRDHKWEEALALTECIDDIYVHGKVTDELANGSRRDIVDRIRQQSALWHVQNPENHDERQAPLSGVRVRKSRLLCLTKLRS